MIGHVDEYPLDDEGIEPIYYKGILGAFAHFIASDGGVIFMQREEDDAEDIGSDVCLIIRQVLIHQAKIIRYTNLTFLLLRLPIRQYLRKASAMIASERPSNTLVMIISSVLFTVKKQNIKLLPSDI